MTWKFDKKVSAIFPMHARQHIPHYDHVIDLSVEICKLHDQNSKIIDVGCAVGETLSRLEQHQFHNIYGVDNSQDMLDLCSTKKNLICSDFFPTYLAPFDVILCNWTLHFILNKIQYLDHMFESLLPGGHLVLTEKTSLDQIPIGFYHMFKQQQGVPLQEIKNKELSLQSVMHINDPLWYLNKLKEIGFSKIWIIDAYWCFTTFLAQK